MIRRHRLVWVGILAALVVGATVLGGSAAGGQPAAAAAAGHLAGAGHQATVSQRGKRRGGGYGIDPCSELKSNGRDPRGVRRGSPNPLAGLSFYVDPSEPAALAYRRYGRQGAKTKARYLKKLALAPKFRWFGRFSPMTQIRAYIDAAKCDGTVPLMVTLRHQGKQCNPHYQAGGRGEDRRTKAWYRQFARVVGDARVVIAFEPDSIGTIECLARSRRKARVAVLRYGVSVLSKLPNATIYLEGTASDWKNARFTARMLRRIGIRKVRGFMLNVTHYAWTISNIRYGYAVSKRVGHKPFVINTSYDGRGPVHYKAPGGRGINVYCNPQLRGIGPQPTTATHFKKVDAFLYINRPGYSGAGGCNGAPRKAGTWWPARALMFGKYGTEWIRPPKHTRFGLRRRVSLCRLGAPLAGAKGYSNVAPAKRCR